MRIRECDLCDNRIANDDGISFNVHDLCDQCVQIVRRVICRDCKGTGKIRVRDDKATDAQASCGENRTQYKTEKCKHCL